MSTHIEIKCIEEVDARVMTLALKEFLKSVKPKDIISINTTFTPTLSQFITFVVFLKHSRIGNESHTHEIPDNYKSEGDVDE